MTVGAVVTRWPNLSLAKEGLGGDSGFWSRHHGSGHGGEDHGGFLSVVTAVFYRAVEVVPDGVVIIGGRVGHTYSRYCDFSGESDHTVWW